jgi:hypothetical protein
LWGSNPPQGPQLKARDNPEIRIIQDIFIIGFANDPKINDIEVGKAAMVMYKSPRNELL